MSTSTASITPVRHNFSRLVEEQKPSKMDINSVIMDYLIKEGYPDSARKFALEANIKQGARDDESMRARVEIKHAIHSGQIQAAIEKINELNPEILDLDASLHFSLLRLQLIEIIRTSALTSTSTPDITPAIHFAKEQLAPRASINRDFLHDLEQTMSLLVFNPDTLSPAIANLLKPDLRREVADRVNAAILKREGKSVEARIKEWVRARAWAESVARIRKKDIPSRIPIGLDGDEEVEDDDMNGDAMTTGSQTSRLAEASDTHTPNQSPPSHSTGHQSTGHSELSDVEAAQLDIATIMLENEGITLQQAQMIRQHRLMDMYTAITHNASADAPDAIINSVHSMDGNAPSPPPTMSQDLMMEILAAGRQATAESNTQAEGESNSQAAAEPARQPAGEARPLSWAVSPVVVDDGSPVSSQESSGSSFASQIERNTGIDAQDQELANQLGSQMNLHAAQAALAAQVPPLIHPIGSENLHPSQRRRGAIGSAPPGFPR